MSAKTKELTFPKNWKEVRERIKNKEITASAGYKQLGITKAEYYKLVKLEKENATDSLEEQTELTPSEYFQQLKDSVKILEDSELKAAFASAMSLMDGFRKTGQEKSMRKLKFLMETLLEEKKLLDLGVDTYVYRSDVERFISKVEKKTVKVIELANYERPIPEEIQEVIKLTEGIFTERYVVFTDYTGKVEKEVKKERRDKDPILFGVFKDNRNHPLSERMYFLGDWVDDKCDLTLDSLVGQMQDMTGETIEHHMQILNTTEDFENALAEVRSKEEDLEVEERVSEDEMHKKDSPRLQKEDPREFRIKNFGEKIPELMFRKVRSILGKKR